jgi:hypothetical protein
MPITRALSRKERFERHVDEATSDLLIQAGQRAGNAEIRMLALTHAIEVNNKRDEWHSFGRHVVDRVVATALPAYFVRTMYMPTREETRPFTDTQHMSERNLKILQTVMEATGLDANQPDADPSPITIGPAEDGSPLPYTVNFDLSTPGVAYAKAAADVIAWDRQNTLFI